MIQRIQTVYLFLAALLLGLFLFLPVATGIDAAGVLSRIRIWGWADPASGAPLGGGALNRAAGALAALTLLSAVITIFLYKKRALQKRLCAIQIVLLLAVCALSGVYLGGLAAMFGVWSLSVPAVFPVLSIVFLLLARRGIVRDDKLVRSLDRIR